jgi:hypothetical protein
MNDRAIGNGDASSLVEAHPIRDFETQDLRDNVTSRECPTGKGAKAIPDFKLFNARPDF